MRNWTTSVIHTNTGMRIKVIPGARMLRMVTMKLTAAITDETPRISRLRVQKSTARPGAYCFDVKLAYANQPTSGGAPTRKLALRKIPPATKIQ